MKLALLTSVFLVVVIGGFFAISKPSDNSGESTVLTKQTEEKLTMNTIRTELASGASLIDVRTVEEYSAGHIAEAEHFGLTEMQAGTLPPKDKTAKMYLYCRSGNRSAQAKTLLEQSGYTNVIDLGAMTNVVALGGSVTP